MDYGFDKADSHRDMQTDTCHGACGEGCAACGARFTVDFRPRDIRNDYFGIEDPKLEGEGAPGGKTYE
jgi:hypothetical protein